MQKTDFKKSLKSLYVLSAKHFAIVDVPKMNFIKIDGAGIPEGPAFAEAVSWLYSISYPLKFLSKQILQKDYCCSTFGKALVRGRHVRLHRRIAKKIGFGA